MLFIKNTAVPSVCGGKSYDSLYFFVVFAQMLEHIREITDFDKLWTVRFHVFSIFVFYQERRCSLWLG